MLGEGVGEGVGEGEGAWDVQRAARPLLAVSRALGLAPLRGAAAWVGVAYAALLCSLLLSSAALYLSWAAAEKYGAILDTKTVLTDVLRTVLTYGAALGAVGASAALHRGRVWPLLARVAAVDRVLEHDRVALYRGARRSLWLLLGGAWLALAAYAVYEAYGAAGDFDQAADWFFHYALTVYPLVFSAVVDLQFVIATHSLRARFLRVNAYFQALLDECRGRNGCCDAFLAAAHAEAQRRAPPPTPADAEGGARADAGAGAGPAVVDDRLARGAFARVYHGGASPALNGAAKEAWGPPGLNTLFRAHDALCEAVEQVNVCFGFQVLLEITCLFVDTICSVYYSVRVSVHRYVHWLLLDVVKVVALATGGHMCTAAANATAPLISRLLLEPAAPRERRLLLRFSQHLLHARAAFCACGLVLLDGGLLAKMAGAVATYIVILVQYKTSGAGQHASASAATATATPTPAAVAVTTLADDDD